MNELNGGDVVYLNSEDRIEMTVVWIDDSKVCAKSPILMDKFILFKRLNFQSMR